MGLVGFEPLEGVVDEFGFGFRVIVGRVFHEDLADEVKKGTRNSDLIRDLAVKIINPSLSFAADSEVRGGKVMEEEDMMIAVG
ncbi:hypothetical protein QYF36_007437 [Acer negundo]|nr:hypothetical protein QYF36_007437 [Acer negundo]